MKDREMIIENAEVPLPKASRLIDRLWSVKESRKEKDKKEKDKLENYDSKFLNQTFHLALAFYKYAPDIRATDLKENKRLWLKTLSEKWGFDENAVSDGYIYKHLILSDDINALGEQLGKLLQMKVEVFDGETTQPLIVGLGEASPYETGITLDFITGLPIIPGSALKGITRRAAIMKLSDNTDLLPYGEEFAKVAQEYDQHERIIQVFGTQDQKGKVIFMDAYPVKWPKGLFRVDIMNPHYGPYYESPDKNPPGDWYNPVPIFYLTVNEDVKYRFVIASKDERLLKTAREWLEFALTSIGVGAKGNQGYGVFEIEKGRE